MANSATYSQVGKSANCVKQFAVYRKRPPMWMDRWFPPSIAFTPIETRVRLTILMTTTRTALVRQDYIPNRCQDSGRRCRYTQSPHSPVSRVVGCEHVYWY